MTPQQQQVRNFHIKAQQPHPTKPLFLSMEGYVLRERLIAEELEELRVAHRAHNHTEVADALADLLYVVLGTAVAHGLDLEPFFEEVHRSNMTKFIDGTRRADGKWLKGPSYIPPNLEPILLLQRKGTK